MSAHVSVAGAKVRADIGGLLTAWEAATAARELMAAATEAGTGQLKPCRYCPAMVLWAQTPGGSGIPIDLGDDPVGQMAMRWDAGRVLVRQITRTQPIRAGERQVTTHFATCPRADDARKPRAARSPR